MIEKWEKKLAAKKLMKKNLVSMNSYLKAEKILGSYAEVKKYPIGHFDIYMGEDFEKAVNDQIEFFKRHF